MLRLVDDNGHIRRTKCEHLGPVRQHALFGFQLRKGLHRGASAKHRQHERTASVHRTEGILRPRVLLEEVDLADDVTSVTHRALPLVAYWPHESSCCSAPSRG